MEENYLSLSELKNLLEKEKDNRGSLSQEQQYALQHAQLFSRIGITKTKELIKELMQIPMIDFSIAVKIADIMPIDSDGVRAILAKERFSLSKEEIDQVLKIVANYQ